MSTIIDPTAIPALLLSLLRRFHIQPPTDKERAQITQRSFTRHAKGLQGLPRLFPTCWQVRLTATSLHQLRLVLQEAISHAALLANLSWKKLVVLKQDDLPMEETMSRRLVRVCIAVKSRCWQGSNTKHRPR